MRKFVIPLVAGIASVALAAVAFAQNPPPQPTLTAKVSPSKAGTRSEPRAASISIDIRNNRESRTTLNRLTVSLPKHIKISTSGLQRCRLSELENEGAEACPSGSRAGSGTAHATLNPHAPADQQTRFTFRIRAFIGGPNTLLFWLQEQNQPALRAALEAKVTRASGKYGRKLTVTVPQSLQQPTPGVYSALDDIQATIRARRGRNSLISFSGCPRANRHDFKADLNYSPNPTPPSQANASATATARCSD